MNKILITVLVLSFLVNIGALFLAYQYWQMRRLVNSLQSSVDISAKTIATLSDAADNGFDHRMVFLHHSVGAGILGEGNLRDSLREMGVVVKGLTYGDSIGQHTDMCDWLPKFQNDMMGILQFQNSPNVYYSDDRTNDIVMFKSCFPNSYVGADDSGPGDPLSTRRTMANYREVFAGLSKEIRKYPNTLFIYMTFPPLVPLDTTPENAARARAFNAWLADEFLPAYSKESGLRNLVIFDLFDVLSDKDNVLKAEYRNDNPRDSHPNALGNREAARKFVEFYRATWATWQPETSDPTDK